jgi:farnesyl-diphosphate farnesyltransferase
MNDGQPPAGELEAQEARTARMERMERMERLLEGSSRTFALTIPFLPAPTRHEVTVAYLLFRIADTLEDAEGWSGPRRRDELQRFGRLLSARAPGEAEAMVARLEADLPTHHGGYLELLRATPEVLAELDAVAAPQRAEMVRFVRATIDGMAESVTAGGASGRIALGSLEELQRYCYYVAGLVGEMLTELMLLDHPALQAEAAALRRGARAFGEGLQLTNILKDSAADAREGRSFLPPGVPRAELFALARADLVEAADYVATLQRAGAPEGYLGFTALPVKLAFATLRRVEEAGPGAKIGRDQVGAALLELQGAIDRGACLVPEAGSRCEGPERRDL